jgi:hypothetical protein
MIRPFSLSRGTEELDSRHAGIMQMVMDRASTESFSKRTMRDFLFLGSLVVFTPSAAAQGAAIRGRVTDPQEAAVVRARLTLDDAAGKHRDP